MVDETVLGGVVLGLERAEERLLSSEDLDRRCRVLGKVEERAGVRDEPGADELANERGEVRSNGRHPVAEVLPELGAVLGDRDDLVAERVDVAHVGVGDLGSHRELGGLLDGCLEVLGEDSLERGGRRVGAEA